MPQLVFRFEDGGEEVVPLTTDSVGVGRDPGNPIVIDDDYISNHHAELRRERDGGYSVVDLGSNNGTYVNARAVRAARLEDGDVIRFGVFEVTFLQNEEPEYAVGGPGEAAWGAPVPEVREEEVIRLEERLLAAQQGLLVTKLELEQFQEARIPEAERRLREVEEAEAEARARLAALAAENEAAEQHRTTLREVEQRLRELEATAEKAGQETEAKRAALRGVVDEVLVAESKLDQARRTMEKVKDDQAEAEGILAAVKREHEQLVQKNQATVAALKDAEEALGGVNQRIAEAREREAELEAENEKLQELVARAQDRLSIAEERVQGRIADWGEFEGVQLEHMVERKRKLEEQSAVAERRVAKARDELKELRHYIKETSESAELDLEDLRRNHYEPTRELHEELTLRNEELATEIARQERHLEELQLSIRDSEETDRLVASTLEEKGQTLERLERRIGDEVKRISAEFVSLQRPVAALRRPTVPDDFGQIFVPASQVQAPLPQPIALGRNGGGKTRITVFDPQSGSEPVDYTGVLELKVDETPLPLGFEGLAAASRGAFSTSLARAVKQGLPVLFLPSEDLEQTSTMLRKLRAALPTQAILLGWRSETFMAVTETLHIGANFQDLVALLAVSNVNVTTDPYMNTFFDSLNQGKRFLFLPPALPWNPAPIVGHAERSGLFVDLTDYHPEREEHRRIALELKEIVEASRQLLTVPELSRGRVRRFLEQVELGDAWVNVVPVPDYRERLAMLSRHLVAVGFSDMTFTSGLLRDCLLSRTPLLGGREGAMPVFYPELTEMHEEGLLPQGSRIARFLEDQESYQRIVERAEKKLLEEHSYQAAAKRLDEFVRGQHRTGMLVS